MRTFPLGRVQHDVAGPPGARRPSVHQPFPGRPWWVWTVPFAAILAVLLARNAFLFTTPLHEDADMGADSILIEQARHFTLLVGNYSREKFNHPGPAFLYVQSWGESLLWSVLHVVPTAWNGQLIALYALNALFASVVVAVGYGWTRSVRGAAAASAAVLLLGALHPAVFSSDWMPYVYVLAYLAFLVAITSVAAGRTRDLWIAAVTGWFCVHGHACFLLFVPFLTCCAILALAWPRRRRLGAALHAFYSARRRDWIPALVISALFLVPIAAELVLHWPGDFGNYLGYGSSKQAGGHGVTQDIQYVLWFWWPHRGAWAVVLILYAVAGAAAWWSPRGPARRLCWFLIAFGTISSALILAYAAVGVDEISQYYIEYFAWTAPIVMVLTIVIAAAAAVPSVPSPGPAPGGPAPGGPAPGRTLAAAVTAGSVAAAVAAGAMFALAPQARTSVNHTDPGDMATGANTDPALPAGLARMTELAGGRPIVLRLGQKTWPEMTGILVQAERTGVPACLADPGWAFMVTSQFICSPAELASGRSFYLNRVPGPVPVPVPARAGSQGKHRLPVVFRLRRAIVTFGGPAT